MVEVVVPVWEFGDGDQLQTGWRSFKVNSVLAEDVQAKHLDNVIVTQTGCIGLCQYEPIVEVYEPGKEKVTYIKMTPEKADEVVEQHLIRGQVLGKYTLSATNL